MTVFTEIATPPKSTKSRNSNSSVKIQIKPKSHCEFVPRDTEKSEFLDLVDVGGVATSVETVIQHIRNADPHVDTQTAIQTQITQTHYMYRVAKTHRMPSVAGFFRQQSH